MSAEQNSPIDTNVNSGRGPILTRHLLHHEGPIFEIGARDRSGASLPSLDVPPVSAAQLFGSLARAGSPGLPEVSEVDVTRHFTRLSRWNHAIDIGMYPLGSCTMKYNPKVNERVARFAGFAGLHPAQTADTVQGALELMYLLEQSLCEISGFARVTLQPAAGAHGELCGLMMIRAYHHSRGRSPKKVLIPDSAHGTNPASAALNQFETVSLKTGGDGLLSIEAVKAAVEKHPGDIAGLMVTNPSTLGLFEEQIAEIAKVVHDAGGLVYMDGANFNALLGKVRPGDCGIDVMHINLHKTFTTPHGGGGPGCGPVGVVAALVPFLPSPTVEKSGDRYELNYNLPQSVGRLRGFVGNFGMMVRAYTYIREMGGAGLTQATEMAVLNANYLRARLASVYPLASEKPSMHEVIFSDKKLKKETGVQTLDVAKRLMDYGFHPPTVYFPLVVPGALMIEPTETESKETLDLFADAMLQISDEAHRDPELVKTAPHQTALRRLDETRAARHPVLRWLPKS